MNETEKTVKKIVEEIVMRPVTDAESLVTSKLIDSMGIVDLAVELEDAFNVKIDTRDVIIENFETIEKICIYLDRKNAK